MSKAMAHGPPGAFTPIYSPERRTNGPGNRPSPIFQITPTDPVRLARTIPLSMWPAHVREQMERRRQGMERALARLEDLRLEMVEKLDALTIDADLENSLAGFGGQVGSGDDREADDTGRFGRPTISDEEPSLGAPEGASEVAIFSMRRGADKRLRSRWSRERNLDQSQWARGRGDEEEEPSLAETGAAARVIRHSGRPDFVDCRPIRDADLEEQEETGEEKDSDFEEDHDGERELGWSIGEWECGQTSSTPANAADCQLGRHEEASLGSLGGTATTPTGSQETWSHGLDGEQEPNGDEGDYTPGLEDERVAPAGWRAS